MTIRTGPYEAWPATFDTAKKQLLWAIYGAKRPETWARRHQEPC